MGSRLWQSDQSIFFLWLLVFATPWTKSVKKWAYILPANLAILWSHLVCQNYFQTEYGTQRYIRNRNLNNQSSSFTFSRQRQVWSFHFDEDSKKCTKIYNARAQSLFCSLNFFVCDIAVAIVVFLNSLIGPSRNGPQEDRHLVSTNSWCTSLSLIYYYIPF